ncbi:MAG: phage tail assembly chaperone [Novosphingobium sp.]
MSEACFANSALRLNALAARALGWRPGEFWAATPAELATILMPPGQSGDAVTRDDLARMMEHQDND